MSKNDKIIKKFSIFENKIFGFKSLDYVDSFAELFTVISEMKRKKIIDGEGNLLIDPYEIGHKVPGFDDLFEETEDYFATLAIVKDILDKYYKVI
jgi:hypothetical protein